MALFRLFGRVAGVFVRLALALAAFYSAWELLQRAWCILFNGRKLTPEEVAASLEVHPTGAVPYERICVSEGSPLLKINGNRAMATGHVLHFPEGGLELATVVHELSHVIQYQRVGPVMMLQALYAQLYGGGYNYGDLAAARRDGTVFADLNREQQAQICEDYYRCKHNQQPWFGGKLEELIPFVEDMQRGEI